MWLGFGGLAKLVMFIPVFRKIIQIHRAGDRSQSGRSLLAIAPPVDGMNVVGMIISPRPSHSPWADVVRHHIAVVGEALAAEWADALLGDDLPIEELPHLSIGAEFPVSPRMERVVNAADAHLALVPFP